ncbi:MAG: tetratricopeptide repeat protein [Candidatus Weimeria sp.]
MKIKNTLFTILSFALIISLSFPMTGCGKKRKQEDYKRDGIEAMQNKDYDKALKDFSNALSQSTTVGADEKDIALYKATAQYKLGKNDDALKTLKGLLEFDSDDEKALYLSGLICCNTGDEDKALSYLTKASSVSKDSELYENAYLALVNAGMRDAADTFYNKMPKDAKASKDVMRLKVKSCEEDGDFSNALEYANSYLEQFPDDEDMKKESEFLTTALMSSDGIDKLYEKTSSDGSTDTGSTDSTSTDSSSETD